MSVNPVQVQELYSSEEDIGQSNAVDTNGIDSEIPDGYKRISDLEDADIINLQFDSEDEAFRFYTSFAKFKGFSIRKDVVRRDDKGNIVMRQFFCSKSGLRLKQNLERKDRYRAPKAITRTNCEARLRILYDYSIKKWVVVSFNNSHNHEMTDSKYVHFIRSYRGLTDADKAQVDSLHIYGVRTCHIMGFIMGQKGGYSDLGFCQKDVYNYLHKRNMAKIEDGDAFAALCYLQAKADNDSMMFSKFTTTEDCRLQHLFWCDGVSRVDYHCFGDVVAFDTTYKKNKYNKPLVIFCGYNHHGETVIFGCALVNDEKTETYKWVLETFSECMFGKHPNALVTDGDGAMREAIKSVFPNSFHRLCGWHVHQNAVDNVKNSKFLDEFHSLMYSNISPEVFESRWKKIVVENGVADHKWVKKTYEMKELWASAYMRDKFFCGIRTTSLCEGINSFIKRYVQNKNSLVDFLHNFERAVKHYRHNELQSDYTSLYTDPVLTTSLQEYESTAAKMFTRKKFWDVKQQIEHIIAYNVVARTEHDDNVCLKMNKFGSPATEFIVLYDMAKGNFACDCHLFQSCGIPCAHIFCAMKYEHINDIPTNLICKRWTKKAKVDSLSSITGGEHETESGNLDLLRSGAISAACNRLHKVATKNTTLYREFITEIDKLIDKFEKVGAGLIGVRNGSKIRDPRLVKTKGAPRKSKNNRKWFKKKCSHCNRLGHNIRACPTLMNRDQLNDIEEEGYSVTASDNEASAAVSEPIGGNDLSTGASSQKSNAVDANNMGRRKGKRQYKETMDRSERLLRAEDGGEKLLQSTTCIPQNLAQSTVPPYNPPGQIAYENYMRQGYPLYPLIPRIPPYTSHGPGPSNPANFYAYYTQPQPQFMASLEEVERNPTVGKKSTK